MEAFFAFWMGLVGILDHLESASRHRRMSIGWEASSLLVKCFQDTLSSRGIIPSFHPRYIHYIRFALVVSILKSSRLFGCKLIVIN